jgi:K(+)-stimulated pyrophosphate-energized sodium pump
MNLVSLLIAPAVVTFSVGADANTGLRVDIAIVAALLIAGAIFVSKRRGTAIAENPADTPVSNGVS